MSKPKLAIVVPCYNEEEVLPRTAKRLLEVLDGLISPNKINDESFILFVDDGSKDRTWTIIEDLAKQNTKIKGLKLTRNFGHQNALLAGMEYIFNKCDCLITIDADLQHDEQAIGEFVQKYIDGAEIVLGIRKDRKVDSIFKKLTALIFYQLLLKMGVNIIKNHADYRLISNTALKALLEFKEVNLFLRGLIHLIGFKTDYVFYDFKERFAGQTKYPLRKMLALALDGITSFSIVPLRLITFIGFLIFMGSLIMSGYIFYTAIFTNKSVPGWASTVLPIYFIGGVQLLSLGIIGEYIGKIYMETKRRPRYILEKEI